MTKAEEVINLIRLEGLSARQACEKAEIALSTFLDHVKSEDLSVQYAQAREIRADHIFEEMLTIADTPVEEEIKVDGDEFSSVTRKDAIQHRRLQVDTRKWILSRMNPKKYGDKIETVTHTGKSLPDWMNES